MPYQRYIVMVLSHRHFRDQEYLVPREVFREDGYDVKIASTIKGEIVGIEGTRLQSDKFIGELGVADFDAIVFVGGLGAKEFFHDGAAHAVASEALKTGKVVGAICIAPSILANAGILKGKRATAYESEKENLKSSGAIWTGAEVEVDGKIVTANGPDASEQFARKIVELIR